MLQDDRNIQFYIAVVIQGCEGPCHCHLCTVQVFYKVELTTTGHPMANVLVTQADINPLGPPAVPHGHCMERGHFVHSKRWPTDGTQSGALQSALGEADNPAALNPPSPSDVATNYALPCQVVSDSQTQRGLSTTCCGPEY